MSAIIGIRATGAIHLATDAATTGIKDGRVWGIHSKQVVSRNRTVIAGVGLWAPCLSFARLIDERTKTFDDVLPVALALWEESSARLSDSQLAIPFATLFAGWSEQRNRLEMHLIRSVPAADDDTKADPATFGVADDVVCYVGGPSDDARPIIDNLTKRWGEQPDAFDPRVDGLEFMERMRRHHPRECEIGRQPAVGGFIEHTAITRTGITTEVIRRWPDRVGHLIEIDGPDHVRPTLMDARAFANVVAAGMRQEELAELRADGETMAGAKGGRPYDPTRSALSASS